MNILPLRLPEELYEELKALSALEKKSMAEIIRQTLKNEIKKKPKEVIKKLKYVDPLLEMARHGERLTKRYKLKVYHYPGVSDDELYYGRAR